MILKIKKKLLIIDHCTSYETPKVIDKLKHFNIDIKFIHKRMASVLQPLDRYANSHLKNF